MQQLYLFYDELRNNQGKVDQEDVSLSLNVRVTFQPWVESVESTALIRVSLMAMVIKVHDIAFTWRPITFEWLTRAQPRVSSLKRAFPPPPSAL